eukprot:scaffold14014_cov146-Isochrysis_galbana.AAC.3
MSAAHKVELGAAGVPPRDIGKNTDTTGSSAEHKPTFWCSFIVVTSAILMPASTDYAGEWKGLGDYAIVVSAVGLGLGLIMLLWYKVIEEEETALRTKRMNLPLFGPINLEMLIAAFLAAWWIVGANILTFKGPHLVPGNGYFSAWGGAFAGVGYLANTSGRSMRTIGSNIMHGSGALHALMVPSIVLIIALTKEYCGPLGCRSFLDTDRYYPESVLGLCVGSISLGFIVLLALCRGCQERLGDNGAEAARWIQKLAALVLLGIWIAGFIVLTFHEPFTSTGNGYFSLVIGLVLSVAFALQQFPDLEKAIEKTTS